MTGDQFALDLAEQPHDAFQYPERERAYTYLDGVKDAAIDKAWCPPPPQKTHELAFDAADYIQSLSDDARKRNVAQLLP